MKTFHFFRVVAVVLLAGGVAGFGQGNGIARVDPSASAGGQQVSASGAANSNGQGATVNGWAGGASVQGPQMQAELATKIDSKTAKSGDAVEARTTKTLTMADGTVIPKGSRLMGTVTQVRAQEKGQDQATLGLSFDRVRLRGGQEVMLRSSIDSVALAVGASAEDEMAMEDMMGAGPMAVGGRGGLGAGGLAGGVGGGVGGAAGRSGNTLTGAGQSAGQRTNGLIKGTTPPVGSSVNGPIAGGAQAGTGTAAHATKVPGVMLSGSAGTSGVLSATGKNVRLESGTQMVLSVAAQR